MIRDKKSNRPDEELARLAADGDAAAFAENYIHYRRSVHSLAVRMTGNQADAQDLTQESFVSIFFFGAATFEVPCHFCQCFRSDYLTTLAKKKITSAGSWSSLEQDEAL